MNNEDKKLAEQWEEEGTYSAELYQAYIDNIGEEYATREDAEEAYAGQYASDEEFAQQLAEEIGAIRSDLEWPNTCIDWEQAAREIMYDYFESDGYYFRNL